MLSPCAVEGQCSSRASAALPTPHRVQHTEAPPSCPPPNHQDMTTPPHPHAGPQQQQCRPRQPRGLAQDGHCTAEDWRAGLAHRQAAEVARLGGGEPAVSARGRRRGPWCCLAADRWMAQLWRVGRGRGQGRVRVLGATWALAMWGASWLYMETVYNSAQSPPCALKQHEHTAHHCTPAGRSRSATGGATCCTTSATGGSRCSTR